MKRDTLYSQPCPAPSTFVFDERVARVFDDMITRSVPLYGEVQEATARLVFEFAQPGTSVIDLGCSTGTTLCKIGKQLIDASVEVVGVDNSEPMITACRHNLAQAGLGAVALRTEELTATDCSGASVVILNYTLQFVAPSERAALLRSICRRLVPGGVLLLSEKIRHGHDALQTCLTELHHEFKRNNGYSDLEISQKRDAIEQVLIPLTTEENIALLTRAGFDSVTIYLKWYTFVSLIAIKSA